MSVGLREKPPLTEEEEKVVAWPLEEEGMFVVETKKNKKEDVLLKCN